MSRCTTLGRPLSRTEQERLAQRLGLKTHPRLTKGVDVLVVSDPGSRSGKAQKAAEYGTRVIDERDFWRELGVPLDCSG